MKPIKPSPCRTLPSISAGCRGLTMFPSTQPLRCFRNHFIETGNYHPRPQRSRIPIRFASLGEEHQEHSFCYHPVTTAEMNKWKILNSNKIHQNKYVTQTHQKNFLRRGTCPSCFRRQLLSTIPCHIICRTIPQAFLRTPKFQPLFIPENAHHDKTHQEHINAHKFPLNLLQF